MSANRERIVENRRLKRAATGLLVLAFAEAAVTAVAAAASGLTWERLVDLFVVTNALIGLSLALAGWPIAYYHPRNLVGWSLLVGGCFYAATGTGLSVLAWAGEPTAALTRLAPKHMPLVRSMPSWTKPKPPSFWRLIARMFCARPFGVAVRAARSLCPEFISALPTRFLSARS